MRVAVTGSRGFIGSHVVQELDALGHTVIHIDHHDGIDVFSMDAYDLIADADAVIHLAGVLGTSELFDTALDAVHTNVNGTISVLQACEAGETHFVGVTMPNVWLNVYQATKRCAFEMAEAWRVHRGVPTSYVRAYNVYGPGQAFGPGHPQKLIPTWSVAAWRGEPLPVWGDGMQTVDLVYAGDVAKVFVDALGYGGGELFDAGTGQQHSLAEVAAMVHVEVFGEGREDLIRFLPMRAGEDPGTRVGAMGEGWELLGWHPEFDRDRLGETIRSYRELAHGDEPYLSEEMS